MTNNIYLKYEFPENDTQRLENIIFILPEEKTKTMINNPKKDTYNTWINKSIFDRFEAYESYAMSTFSIFIDEAIQEDAILFLKYLKDLNKTIKNCFTAKNIKIGFQDEVLDTDYRFEKDNKLIFQKKLRFQINHFTSAYNKMLETLYKIKNNSSLKKRDITWFKFKPLSKKQKTHCRTTKTIFAYSNHFKRDKTN